MFRKIRSWMMVPIATGVALTVLGAGSGIDASKSSVVSTFKQAGVPVEAPFRVFSGQIVYDPANVASASAAIDIDTGSIDIGDEAYSAEVRKAAWFDSARFPKATFRSTAIKPGPSGRFDATGTLTIKGKSQAVTVPVTVKSIPGGTAFDGSFVLSRKTYTIGDPSWNEVLDDSVTVRFHLVNPNR